MQLILVLINQLLKALFFSGTLFVDSFLNTNWVSMDILRLLINKLEVAAYFNKSWEKDFEKEFAPGASITVKFPQRFLVIDGMQYAPQGINRIATTITVDQWLQVPFEWDDYEKAVKLERSEEELRKNYFEPASAALQQEWDSRAAQYAYQNANNVMGVLGTDATSVGAFYDARRRLQELAAPAGERALCISSSMMRNLGVNITTFFQPGDELKQIFKKGYLGEIAGFDVLECNSLWSHTAGTWASTVSVTGAGQSGGSLIITGTAGDTLKKGDKFSIANVNQVNPMTRRTAGPLAAKQFTVTQDYTLSGGADTISILPAIYGPGSQYQNVDALPANNAALTLWPGTSSPNGKVGTVGLGLTEQAFALVGVKLYLPKMVEDKGEAYDKETGLGVRFVKAWDPVRSMQIHRFDSLGGFGVLYQDNGAVTLAGA